MVRPSIALTLLFLACSDGATTTSTSPPKGDTGADSTSECTPKGSVQWQVLSQCREKGELLSVGGTSRSDVWAVGTKGQALYFDGCEWSNAETGTTSDLWWVHAFDDGTVFMSGSNGTILRKSPKGDFEKMETGVDVTLFGIWGSSPTDMWSIGFMFDDSSPGVILRYDGTSWRPVTDIPEEMISSDHFFKVWGSSATDVWVVGSQDMILHWDGKTWSSKASGEDQDWVTVTGTVDANGKTNVIVVGGTWEAAILQRTATGWVSVGPSDFPGLQGVCIQPDGNAMATGVNGTLLTGSLSPPWTEALGAPEDLEGCDTLVPDYHACFADGEGGFFVVGGNFLGGLTDGALLYYGAPIPTTGL